MEKIIQPWGWTGGGAHEIFEVLDPYELRQGKLEKVAGSGVHPRIMQYIDQRVRPDITPDSPYIYILASNMGACESWGCFPAGTRVLMDDGKEKSIEQVREGEFVATHDGDRGRVVATQKRANDERLVSLSLTGSGACVRCTPNHPILIIPRDQLISLRRGFYNRKQHSIDRDQAWKIFIEDLQPEWCPAFSVRPGDYVLEPIPSERPPIARALDTVFGGSSGSSDRNSWVSVALSAVGGKGVRRLRDVDFDDEVNAIALARLLGYYAAEGCLYKGKGDNYTGVIYVCGQDKPEGSRILESAQQLGLNPCVTENCQGTQGTRIQIPGIILAQMCLRLIGHGSKDKFIHTTLMQQEAKWKWEFLGAYFDGDGSQERSGKAKGTIRSSSASRELTCGIVRILSTLGVLATWHAATQHESAGGGDIHPLSVGKYYGVELSRYVPRFDPPPEVEHSTTLAYLIPGYIARPVKEVERTVIASEVYNLEVAHKHSYVVENISVSNSNINADAFTRSVLAYDGPKWGIQTFLDAGIYKHHKNKDKTKSYGSMPFVLFASALDGYMDRVESVVRIDREKAAKVGAEDVCQALDRGEFVPWSMGCVRAGTLITRYDGTQIPIEDIELGDEVLTHLGHTRGVYKLHRREYNGRMFRLESIGHSDLVLTEEHPLFVLRRETLTCAVSAKHKKQSRCVPSVNVKRKKCVGCEQEPNIQPEWVCAEHVEIGDFLLSPVHTHAVDQPEWSDALLRLMGLYLAEGYMRKDARRRNHHLIEFCLGVGKERVAACVEQLLHEEGADWVSRRDRSPRITVGCRSERLYSLFAEHLGQGSLGKYLSQEIMQLPPHRQAILLGAYADGDGGEYKGALYLSTANEDLAQQLRLICLRVGMIVNVGTIHHQPSTIVRRETTEYQLWVGKDHSHLLNGHTIRLDLGHEVTTINNRRFLVDHEGCRYLATPILSKEEEHFNGLVYNFEVMGDESYVTEGLAAHNCRVQYDVCSFCGNKAKTRKEYCTHMKQYPNQIITADFYGRMDFSTLRQEHLGLRIWVFNPRPVFFDFSRVLIGAAPEAKTLMKVATAYQFISSAKLAEMVMKGAADKTSTIEKEVEGGDGPVGQTLKVFSDSENPLPDNMLNMLGAQGLPRALSTTGLMGMVLRPREFQRVALSDAGRPDLADDFDQKNIVFPQTSDVEPCHAMLAKDFFVKALAHALMHLVPERSAYGPVIKKRMIRIVISRAPTPPPTEMDHPGLKKISALYNGYRLGLLEKIANVGPEILTENPELLSRVYDETLEDVGYGITKQSENLLSMPTVSYLLHAHGFDAPGLLQKNPAAATPVLRQAARVIHS